MTDESVCLDAPERDDSARQPKVRIMACSGTGRQKWSYSEQVSSCSPPPLYRQRMWARPCLSVVFRHVVPVTLECILVPVALDTVDVFRAIVAFDISFDAPADVIVRDVT